MISGKARLYAWHYHFFICSSFNCETLTRSEETSNLLSESYAYISEQRPITSEKHMIAVFNNCRKKGDHFAIHFEAPMPQC